MPSPFPGMDPYLESPELWPDLHHELISVIREILNIALRPAYHASIEERVYISDENDSGRRVLIPDVAIQSTQHLTGSAFDRPTTRDDESGIAVAEPILATTVIEDEIHEAYVAIKDLAGRKVVTVIDVLSPANKISGSRGRASYESKRREIMHSETHFVEIDLLHEGLPIVPGERIPPHSYLVHVSRFAQRPQGMVWPILLTQRLPTIPIPLLPKSVDIQLDLGAVLNTAYDRAGYDLIIDYQSPPGVSLSEPNSSWCRQWLARRKQ